MAQISNKIQSMDYELSHNPINQVLVQHQLGPQNWSDPTQNRTSMAYLDILIKLLVPS